LCLIRFTTIITLYIDILDFSYETPATTRNRNLTEYRWRRKSRRNEEGQHVVQPLIIYNIILLTSINFNGWEKSIVHHHLVEE
jgi:hypothetical protein